HSCSRSWLPARRRALLAASLWSGALAAADPSVLDPASMDRSVDPCTDFYAYSCAGWLRNNPIPPDQSRWSAYSNLQDETLQRLKQILEQASKGSAERSPAEQKIGDYYTACMDETAAEKLGAAALAERLAAVEAIGSKREIAGWLGRNLPLAPSAFL